VAALKPEALGMASITTAIPKLRVRPPPFKANEKDQITK
jgi:hypothetical protein